MIVDLDSIASVTSSTGGTPAKFINRGGSMQSNYQPPIEYNLNNSRPKRVSNLKNYEIQNSGTKSMWDNRHCVVMASSFPSTKPEEESSEYQMYVAVKDR